MKTEPIILGTAGHIDHGKTSLIKALTGIDTDRLKEEKERGITIELGFAHLDVGERRFGVVDVPGHERFLKSMVAGAAGIDVVMLVIAADEGVMPQTREHLDVCQLLGLERGVIVLTKRDLVEADWLALVEADVREFVKGTFLAEARMLAVSAATGEGLDELRAEILRLAGRVRARPADGTFRLPLDRVFTLRGFGTVVTGTILGGRLAAGDDVAALPGGRVAKVRTVEVHGESAPHARAGMRCAANLVGVERHDVRRGEILVHPGAIEPAHLCDARFRLLPVVRQPLERRARVLLHHATLQQNAQIVLADREILRPGEEALVQLHLEVPVAALPGDRFIARGFVVQEHHGTTIGGGEILRVHAPKVRRSSAEIAAALQALADAEPTERVALEVAGAGPAAMPRATLLGRLGLSPAAIDAALGRLVDARELVRDGDAYLHATVLARAEAAALAALDAFHAAEPLRDGMPREELRTRLPRALPPRFFDRAIDGLVARGAVETELELVRRARKRRDNPLVDRVVEQYRAWGLETPRPEDVAGALTAPAADTRAALDTALRAGRLVRVRPDYYVEKSVLDALRDKLRAALRAHGQVTAQDWKTLTGVSRKYAIPLAEHFDAEKVTLRIGDVRKARG
ncbi:MAG TPA: selenocysteine-specific translation elongation factor [Haliangiales bacterium]|nr:selenocysteine-specific translation elongation factor [Haliangiales bacterium]